MVLVIGFIKHGYRAEAKKMISYQLNYLGMFILKEIKNGEKRQDELLGDPRIAAQECDCDFSTSGDTVFYSEWIDFIAQTTIKDPLERRGADQNLWIWEPADYSTRLYDSS
jgi:hypothetical protein